MMRTEPIAPQNLALPGEPARGGLRASVSTLLLLVILPACESAPRIDTEGLAEPAEDNLPVAEELQAPGETDGPVARGEDRAEPSAPHGEARPHAGSPDEKVDFQLESPTPDALPQAAARETPEEPAGEASPSPPRDAEEAPPGSTPAERAAEVPPPSGSLKETTEEALLAEIESRVLREWQVLSGEFSGGDEIKQEYTTLRRRAARRIIGLGVLLESIESEEKPDEKLRAALEAASEHLRGPENDLASRVLAAAQLARSADEEAVGGLLRELAPPAAGSAPEDDSAPGDDSTSKDDSAPKDGSAPKDRAGQEGKAPEGKEAEKEKARAGTGGKPAGGQFALASLAIARSIEGPGRFTPLPEEQVGPGKAFLIYGEFTNFTTVPAAGSRHRASFSASLKLLGPKNDIIGVLDFLPVGRGDQTMVSPAEKLNFWARYRLPASLAPGTYRMVVTARDLLGGKTATAQLQFRVKG